jgi:hypothetical protein
MPDIEFDQLNSCNAGVGIAHDVERALMRSGDIFVSIYSVVQICLAPFGSCRSPRRSRRQQTDPMHTIFVRIMRAAPPRHPKAT